MSLSRFEEAESRYNMRETNLCFYIITDIQYQQHNLKVPSHESYKQRRAPPRACLHQEEMPPFPLALGFNATIPPHSKVAECPAQFTMW